MLTSGCPSDGSHVSGSSPARDTLVFVPHYLGSLLYFEKLIPYIHDRYDVLFLLNFGNNRYVEEMAAYCAGKGYSFYRIAEPKMGIFGCFELFYFLRGAAHYKKELPKFLEHVRIKKVITLTDGGFYMGYLFAEAEKRGIDAMVLQWALTYHGQKSRPKRIPPLFRRLLYRFGKPVYIFLQALAFRVFIGPNFSFSKTILGGGVGRRFGVINQQAYDFFLSHGIPKEKMAIVGSLEFAAAEKTFFDLRTNPAREKEARARLGLNDGKKNIVFYSSPYNVKDITILTDEEQYLFTERVMGIIRDVCPEEGYNLLLKVHPKEETKLYEPLARYGVKIFHKDADNAELVYFSDLYIDGGSTTNFIPILEGKEALFINPLKLAVVETTADHFGINRYVHEYEEFRVLLELFKRGKLPKQYTYKDEIFTKNSLRKILHWIG